MGRVAKTFGWLGEAVLWIQCTVMVRLRTEGWFWVIGRHARERAFIRRLLVEFPGLAEQPRQQLNRVADRTLGSLTRWRSQVVTFGSMGIAGFAAKALWSFLFAWGAPLPPWTRPPAIVAGVIVVGEAVRRHYIRQDMTRALASVYPTLFCTCGYCLLNLPNDVARCPECGAARVSTASSSASAAGASPSPPVGAG
jgi:hypothetical protein